MPALDFPANPTNGQVYANWIYSTSKGAWQAKPITGKVTTSAVAPSTPTNGDEWFNTNDGNLYVYYTDVDGSQWVQVKSDATLSSTLGNRVTTLENYPSGLVPVVPTSTTYTGGTAPTISALGEVVFGSSTVISLNGCFTSSYTNYKILYTNTGGTVNGNGIFMRLRSAGVDNSTNNYFLTGNTVNNAGTASNRVTSATADWYVTTQKNQAARMGNFWLDVTNPYDVSPTYTNGQTSYDNGANFVHEQYGGSMVVSASYDGFTLYSASGFSGILRVYGMR